MNAAGVCSGMEFSGMNTTISVMVETKSPLAYWQQPIIKWFAEFEQTASRFRESSELSALNRAAAGTPSAVSATLYRLLKRSWHFAAISGFMFQPFIGTSLQKLGYSASFEQIEKFGGICRAKTAEADTSGGIGGTLEFDDRFRTVTKYGAQTIDLGGIGKGWSAQQAAGILQSWFDCKAGLVDVGGDIAVWSDDQPWLIGIQNPWNEQTELAQLWIRNGAVATSSIMRRNWLHQGKRAHHILLGKTGQPADSDIVQATAVAESADEADVAAKVIIMLGTGGLADWNNGPFRKVGFIAVTSGGNVIMHRNVLHYAQKVE